MSLRIKHWRLIAKWVGWSLAAIVFLVFLVRVSVFEQEYYNAKEGSERAAAQNVESNLIEEQPTEAEVEDYLTIEKLGINRARVLPVGVNVLGELATPDNVYDVGWYDSSGKPGQGKTMLIDGHNGGPHVFGEFKNLPDLADGDIIEVERGDGKVFKYRVQESRTVALADADAYMAVAMQSPEEGRESITLISCTGEWSDQRQTYLSRQFVRGVLVE